MNATTIWTAVKNKLGGWEKAIREKIAKPWALTYIEVVAVVLVLAILAVCLTPLAFFRG